MFSVMRRSSLLLRRTTREHLHRTAVSLHRGVSHRTALSLHRGVSHRTALSLHRGVSTYRVPQRAVPQDNALLSRDNVSVSDRGLVDRGKELLHLETRIMCRCEACFGRHSHQKSNYEVDQGVKITGLMQVSDDFISAKWSDGHAGFIPRTPKGAYGTGPVPGLLDKYLDVSMRRNSAQNFWDCPDSEVMKRYQFDDVTQSDQSVREFLAHFMRNGLAFLSKLPSDLEPTSVLSDELKCGPIFETTWGPMDTVQFCNDETNHAYHSGGLVGHTDLPYYTATPPVFVFYCKKNTTIGGEGLYVDTFAALNKIRKERPDMFKVLSETDMYYAYNAPNYHTTMFSSQKTVEMRGQDIFRVVDHLPCQDEFKFAANTDIATREAWLAAVSYYRELIADSSRAAVRYLEEGDLVLVDNWRVLHGRKEFSAAAGSQRIMNVMYLDWSHVQNRLLNTLGHDSYLDLPKN